MFLKKSPYSTDDEITPKEVYFNRRKFLAGMGIAGAAALAGREAWKFATPAASADPQAKLSFVPGSYSTKEKITPFKDVTHYNNFYEFGTGKSDPARNAGRMVTSPWTVSVEGEVKNRRKYSLAEIEKLAPLEERIYRHRCVEGWSIVVPWIGYSLGAILRLAEPTPKAKYVAFQSYFNPAVMPWAASAGISFPYVEGLRLDEAMHPLTLLSVGMYGEALPNQDGAPVRIVLPWKYGYKSIKSLVKIRLVAEQPPTTWNEYSSSAYGFYSNVNPGVDTVPWSQAYEHRLGQGLFARPIPTRIFNGYGDQVASLYRGMDLRKYH
ncbi:MAG TPA: protein-methionine-sulfoxide reductase catalytic subunit MsrP [Patescibacteria group bacterium]|nr:protein-methionine-sulfoxide reductase catalytic subunit MsrP [Patescibacteria group bacterium]